VDNLPRAQFSAQRIGPLTRMAQIFAVMLIGLLVGCAQHEAPLERDALDATVAMATNDDEFCRSYGAKPGTQSYVECRLNLSNQRTATTPTPKQ
jgi:hypothetical protein